MEEEKREEAQRVMVELKLGDDRTQTVLLTAGTAALLMAWLKRAVMVCLVEQWRAWVFLALNLVLLAIVFTSARTSSSATAATSEDEETKGSSSNNNTNGDAEVVETERKKRRKECRGSGVAVVEVRGNELKISGCDHKRNGYSRRRRSVEVEGVDEEAVVDAAENRGLSKEELNERVEAFITMFRQHLVLDARRGRRS